MKNPFFAPRMMALCSFVLSGALACSAQAATLYVAPSGATYSKVQDAVRAAAPGDTVLVGDGTYNEWIEPKSGRADAWITIKAQNKGKAKIVSPVTDRSAIHMYATRRETSDSDGYPSSHRYIIIDGLDLSSPDAVNNSGLEGTWAHHITIRNCRISGGRMSGVNFGFSDYITVEDCEVFNNCRTSSMHNSGIALWKTRPFDQKTGYHNVIVRNRCYNNSAQPGAPRHTDANGIAIDTCFQNTKTLIANNVLFNNGGRAINIAGSSNVDIFHNTCYKNSWDTEGPAPYSEILLQNVFWDNDDPSDTNSDFNVKPDHCSNINVVGNILYARNGAVALRVEPGAVNINIDRNVLYNNAYPSFSNTFANDGRNAIKADPLFVSAPPEITINNFNTISNPGAGDFHLKSQSPAINWFASRLVTDDFDKVARPQGGNSDVGAYEYQGFVGQPGFEGLSNVSAPWSSVLTTNASAGIDTGNGLPRSGNKSAYIYAPAGTPLNSWNRLQQGISLSPNTNYTLIAWVQTSNLGGTWGGYIGVNGGTSGGNNGETSQWFGTSNGWSKVNLNFRTGSNTNYTLYSGYFTAGSGDSWIRLDDISINRR